MSSRDDLRTTKSKIHTVDSWDDGKSFCDMSSFVSRLTRYPCDCGSYIDLPTRVALFHRVRKPFLKLRNPLYCVVSLILLGVMWIHCLPHCLGVEVIPVCSTSQLLRVLPTNARTFPFVVSPMPSKSESTMSTGIRVSLYPWLSSNKQRPQPKRSATHATTKSLFSAVDSPLVLPVQPCQISRTPLDPPHSTGAAKFLSLSFMQHRASSEILKGFEFELEVSVNKRLQKIHIGHIHSGYPFHRFRILIPASDTSRNKDQVVIIHSLVMTPVYAERFRPPKSSPNASGREHIHSVKIAKFELIVLEDLKLSFEVERNRDDVPRSDVVRRGYLFRDSDSSVSTYLRDEEPTTDRIEGELKLHDEHVPASVSDLHDRQLSEDELRLHDEIELSGALQLHNDSDSDNDSERSVDLSEHFLKQDMYLSEQNINIPLETFTWEFTALRAWKDEEGAHPSLWVDVVTRGHVQLTRAGNCASVCILVVGATLGDTQFIHAEVVCIVLYHIFLGDSIHPIKEGYLDLYFSRREHDELSVILTLSSTASQLPVDQNPSYIRITEIELYAQTGSPPKSVSRWGFFASMPLIDEEYGEKNNFGAPHPDGKESVENSLTGTLTPTETNGTECDHMGTKTNRRLLYIIITMMLILCLVCIAYWWRKSVTSPEIHGFYNEMPRTDSCTVFSNDPGTSTARQPLMRVSLDIHHENSLILNQF